MRKSIYDLLAQNTASFPDNTSQAITPALLRTMFKDFLDTMQPAYGSIERTAPLVVPITATPQRIAPFDNTVIISAPDFSGNLTTGTVNILLAGGTQKVTRITIVGIVEGPSGQDVTCEVYLNGVATGFLGSAVCAGAGKPVGFNITGLTNTTIDTGVNLFMYGTAGNYTISETGLICENIPVIGP